MEGEPLDFVVIPTRRRSDSEDGGSAPGEAAIKDAQSIDSFSATQPDQPREWKFDLVTLSDETSVSTQELCGHATGESGTTPPPDAENSGEAPSESNPARFLYLLPSVKLRGHAAKANDTETLSPKRNLVEKANAPSISASSPEETFLLDRHYSLARLDLSPIAKIAPVYPQSWQPLTPALDQEVTTAVRQQKPASRILVAAGTLALATFNSVRVSTMVLTGTYRRIVIVSGLGALALVGTGGAVVFTVANGSHPPAVHRPLRVSGAIGAPLSTFGVTTKPSQPAVTAPPTAVTTTTPPGSSAAAPAVVVPAPAHAPNITVITATPEPTSPPSPPPTPTPAPTPTPPTQFTNSASGYLSTTSSLHICTPITNFTASSLFGPDGFNRSCTYTFTESVAGTISATFSSTGEAVGTAPVVQAGGYCIVLYGQSGSTALAKSCTGPNTSGPATLSKDTSTLTQKTGVFRLEVEAMSTKTSFTLNATHY